MNFIVERLLFFIETPHTSKGRAIKKLTLFPTLLVLTFRCHIIQQSFFLGLGTFDFPFENRFDISLDDIGFFFLSFILAPSLLGDHCLGLLICLSFLPLLPSDHSLDTIAQARPLMIKLHQLLLLVH